MLGGKRATASGDFVGRRAIDERASVVEVVAAQRRIGIRLGRRIALDALPQTLQPEPIQAQPDAGRERFPRAADEEEEKVLRRQTGTPRGADLPSQHAGLNA